MSFRGAGSPRLGSFSLSFKDVGDWFSGFGISKRGPDSEGAMVSPGGTTIARRVPSTSLLAKKQQARGAHSALG